MGLEKDMGDPETQEEVCCAVTCGRILYQQVPEGTGKCRRDLRFKREVS